MAMPLAANTEMFMEQYLKTATNGKVVSEFAFAANRMRLCCKECDMLLTVPIPDDPTAVDFQVQEFVKLHAHRGAYPGFAPHSIDKKAEAVLAELKGGDKPDKDYEKSAKIEEFTKKYAESLKKKLDDAVVAKKIEMLQKEGADPGKLSKAIGELSSMQKMAEMLKPEVIADLVNQAYQEGQKKTFHPLPTKSGGQTAIIHPFEVGDVVDTDDDDDYKILEQPTAPLKAFFDSAGNCGAIVNGKKIYWVKDTNGNIVGVSETPPVKVQPKPKENLLQETGRKFR